MNESKAVPQKHIPKKVVALYVVVAILCAALLGLAGWWYFYENPNSGGIQVHVQNASPSNETGAAEVWVAMDGPANSSENPHMASLSISSGMSEIVVFPVAGEACQSHSISLYLNIGPNPQVHATSTQFVTVCGGEYKSVVFTVTNTY